MANSNEVGQTERVANRLALHHNWTEPRRKKKHPVVASFILAFETILLAQSLTKVINSFRAH